MYATVGDALYAVLAVAWDDETNMTRYLVATPERPTWVSEHDLVRTVINETPDAPDGGAVGEA
jgi:hypothetical protein